MLDQNEHNLNPDLFSMTIKDRIGQIKCLHKTNPCLLYHDHCNHHFKDHDYHDSVDSRHLLTGGHPFDHDDGHHLVNHDDHEVAAHTPRHPNPPRFRQTDTPIYLHTFLLPSSSFASSSSSSLPSSSPPPQPSTSSSSSS